MGGIAGIIRFDGQGINPSEMDDMIRLLNHRGNIMRTSVQGGILMAFDGFVETAEGTEVTSVTDADVYSSKFPDRPFCDNYIQAGPGAFNEPNADFAVALWDADIKTLYCARDILGVKPLYYIHQPNRFFAFASEIKALTVLGEVPVKPNRSKFREYLTWTTASVPYSAETFYEGIYSILPGHYLAVTPEHVKEKSYWKPDFQRYHNLGGLDTYSSIFRDVFTDAIDRRTKNKQNIGSHLSGGLDSSSVSCVSQSLLVQQSRPALYTFNIDTEQSLAEEQQYVQDVVHQHHTNHFRLTPLPDVLDSVIKINKIFDRPEQFIIPSSFHLSVSEKAKKLGCQLILNGHGGDNVATTGFSLLNDLMTADDWSALQIAAEQYFDCNKNSHFKDPKGQDFRTRIPEYEKYVISLITGDLKHRRGNESLVALLSRLRAHKKRFGLSEAAIISFVLEKLRSRLTRIPPIEAALSREFIQQNPLRTQRTTKELANKVLAKNNIFVEGVLDHTNVICNEQLNHIGAYYGHQYSFPFFDKNVIELCLSTPVEMRFDKGRGRALIRHGMKHVLPPSIQKRNTKANFVEFSTLTAQQLYKATQPQLASSAHPIWEIVDRKVFQKITSIVFNQRIDGRLKTRYNWQLSRIVYLSIWLESL